MTFPYNVNRSFLPPAAGVTGAYEGNSRSLRIIIGFFTALTLYNSLELIAIIIFSFKRWQGLYFWSLLVASIALTPYALGFSLRLFGVDGALWPSVVLLTIGWVSFFHTLVVFLLARFQTPQHPDSVPEVGMVHFFPLQALFSLCPATNTNIIAVWHGDRSSRGIVVSFASRCERRAWSQDPEVYKMDDHY